MRENVSRICLLLCRVAPVLFFAALFAALTRPVTDNDIWWHLASGREIMAHRAVPALDPFGVPGVPLTSRVNTAVTLRQEWLAQVILYGVHLLGGLKAIVLLRATLGTAVFATVYLLVRRAGAGVPAALALVATAVHVSVFEIFYVGERPQLWSSLFFPVVFLVMERLRGGDRRAAWALPPLMCLWSNLHGGFLMGDLVILAYLLVALVSRRGTRTLYVAGGLGVLASLANPAGPLVAVTAASMFFDPAHRELVGHIEEYRSVLTWFAEYRRFGLVPVLPAMMLLAGLSFLPLFRRGRGLRPEWLALYCITLLLSLVARRYVIFFSTLAPVFIAGNVRAAWDAFTWRGRARVERVWAAPVTGAIAGLLVLLVSAPNLSRAIKVSAFLREHPSGQEYAGAIAFLRDNGLAGNLFSTYSEGGLLIWRLSPRIRLFLDPRGLSLAAWQGYQTLMGVDLPFSPGGEGEPPHAAVLDRYGLDYVLIPSCDPRGRILPLVYNLQRDPAWALVYADAEALLFMRITAEHKAFVEGHRLPLTAIFDNIIAVALRASRTNPHLGTAPEWMLSAAYASWWKQDVPAARLWLDRYLAVVPQDRAALAFRALIPGGTPGAVAP